jgi:hypothetical protein
MQSLPRRLGLLLASTAALSSLSVLGPTAAFAETTAAASSAVSVSDSRPRHCKPAHWGRDWRWHEGRHGGHWDHWERKHRHRHGEWKHHWRDDRYCEKRWGHDKGRDHDKKWDNHR